jgi:hypothetical protein
MCPNISATLNKLSPDIWHQCMGHASHNALKSHGPSALTGMDCDSSTIPHVCHGCEVGKSTHKPFPVVCTPKTMHTFEIVHSDLCSPMQSDSIQKSSYYYASFIDDFSNHTLVYFLESKNQFPQALKQFLPALG